MANPLNHYLPRDRKVLYLAYLLRLSKQPLLTFANKDIPLRITCSDYTKKRALKHQEQERRKQNATRYLKESTQKLFINTSQRLKNKRIKRPLPWRRNGPAAAGLSSEVTSPTAR